MSWSGPHPAARLRHPTGRAAAQEMGVPAANLVARQRTLLVPFARIVLAMTRRQRLTCTASLSDSSSRPGHKNEHKVSVTAPSQTKGMDGQNR